MCLENYTYKILGVKETKSNTPTMDKTKETMSRLKLLGTLKKGEKINTKTISIQGDNFMTSLSRKFYVQDNRTNMISFVEDTVSKTFDILDKYKSTNNTREENILYSHILEDLKQSIIGLERLKETYITDSKIVCDIDTFIEVIDARLQTLPIMKYNINSSAHPLSSSSPVSCASKSTRISFNHETNTESLVDTPPVVSCSDGDHYVYSTSISPPPPLSTPATNTAGVCHKEISSGDNNSAKTSYSEEHT